jgi:hypothetical protein
MNADNWDADEIAGLGPLTPAERASIAAALRHWREAMPYHRRALQTKPHAALSDAELAVLAARLTP